MSALRDAQRRIVIVRRFDSKKRDDAIHLQRRTIISLDEELAVSKDRVSSQQQQTALLVPRPPTSVDAAFGTADAERRSQ